MGTATHSIEVHAPLRAVYNQWTQFEEFPQFMEGVEEVRQEGNKRLFWRATIGGKTKEWEAEITEQIPDERIAWQSVDGTPNAGTITFEKLDSEHTRVTAAVEYEPEGFIEKAGDALGIPSGRIEGDLTRFREFIEQRGYETGGWRGQIGEEEGLPATSSAQTNEPAFSRMPSPEKQIAEEPIEPGAQVSKGDGQIAAEIPLSEERVKVGKKTVGAGEVRLRKNVSTEQVNVPVELKREDVVIEKISGQDIEQTGKEPFQEEKVEVPLSREEPVVEKEIHVTGGVRVRKTDELDQETIQESVRREDVDVDERGKTSRRKQSESGAEEKTM
ncbi:MAG: DUF2382 domain-containing protein [Verrucomicrobia bacterium]|nr:DUF2382 domain-containing protein [Verrucomicrobiota bacterium]